jgi:hypothetical protein
MFRYDGEDDSLLVWTTFNLPSDFIAQILYEDGYELSRDEEAKLENALTELRIYFEVDTNSGQVLVLGAR